MPPRPLTFALPLLAVALCPAIALADDGYLDVAIADLRFPADPEELAAAGLGLPPTPAPPDRLDEPWRMLVPPTGRGADVGARIMCSAWQTPAPASGPVSRPRSQDTSIPNPPIYLNIEPRR